MESLTKRVLNTLVTSRLQAGMTVQSAPPCVCACMHVRTSPCFACPAVSNSGAEQHSPVLCRLLSDLRFHNLGLLYCQLRGRKISPPQPHMTFHSTSAGGGSFPVPTANPAPPEYPALRGPSEVWKLCLAVVLVGILSSAFMSVHVYGWSTKLLLTLC